MDPSRLATLSRALASPTRRGLLVLSSVAMSGPLALLGSEAKKRKRKQKLKKNAFGCIDVGKPCRGKDSHCCSGICQGKKPKRGERDRSHCAAHGEDQCQNGQNLTGCGGQTVNCTTSTGDVGACRTTTGKAGYCAADGQCRQCARDADCRPFCGPEAACVVCEAATCEFGTQCVGPADDGCTF